MKVKTASSHVCDRYGFAWQQVPAGSEAHLDFGCGDGRFLKSLRGKGIKCLVGVDVGREAIRRAQEGSGGLEIIHLGQTRSLPFPDQLFSSITLMDVLEHVTEQQVLLDELHRVLQDDGLLIVTVPGRHVFSSLDMGNLKFRFPRLHRWYYCRTHSVRQYEKRYLANPDGLIGDVSARKRWHEHFSPRQLADRLDGSGFEVVTFDGAGFFTRVLKMADWLLGRWRLTHAAIARLMAWDARVFRSANIFCVAQKTVASCGRQTGRTLNDHDSIGYNLETADPQHVLQRCGADE